ncbi:toll-like receptor 4 [Lissotriton helveticus]
MNLSSLDDLFIGFMSGLQELNIGRNKIKSLKIPQFFTSLKSLRILDLHANMISSIFVGDLYVLKEMDTFNLTVILSLNSISHIEPESFLGIHFHKLILRYSFADADTMQNCLLGLTGLWANELQIGNFNNYLDFNFKNGLLDGLCHVEFYKILLINFGDFPNDTDTVFNCLVNATVIRLVRSGLNHIREMPKFTRLRYLEIKHCFLTEVPGNQLSNLTPLKALKITNGDFLRHFDGHLEGLPNLLSLDVSQNRIILVSCCPHLETPRLQHLNLSFNSIITMSSHYLHLENLLTLDFQHTKLVNFGTTQMLSQLSRLLYLDVSHSDTTFFLDCAFCGLESLQVLKLAGNQFGPNIISTSFCNLTELIFLDVASCSLESLQPQTFSRLEKLQELNISNNKLLVFDPAVYAPLKALTILDFSRNQIPAFLKNAQESLPGNLVLLDLSQNPFDCSCTHLYFLQWVKSHKTLLGDGKSMICNTPGHLRDEKVRNVNLSTCDIKLFTVLLPVSLLICTFLVLFLIYKCYFQHYYRLLLSKWCIDPADEADMYDAFVIYSSKDEEWVTGLLVKKLEEGVPPIRLCLHFRDFMPGVLITSNIVKEGFLKSRKAVVVVSDHFLESKWCSFEFELARSWQFLETTSGIIVVVLQEVDKARLRHVLGLHKYLRRNTYLEWKHNAVEQHLFWMKMRKALLDGKP